MARPFQRTLLQLLFLLQMSGTKVNLPDHKERVKARQQRRISLQPPPEDSSQIDTSRTSIPITRSIQDQNIRAGILSNKRKGEKNEKRSRSGKGRGMPKKGGAGGKGSWGKPGTMDDLYEGSSFDKNDPNYDSESEDKNIKMYDVEVTLTTDQAKKIIRDLITEFFDHADTDDLTDSACELNVSGDQFYLFAKEAILLGLDTTSDSNRELVSVLLSDLFGYTVLLSSDMEQAFTEILTDMDDLVLDCPDAPTLGAKYMARCVADDCLPPKFIESLMEGSQFSGKAKDSLTSAHARLIVPHGLIALDNIWNSGDYRKPVKYLVRKIKLMLEEYQDSWDYKNFVQSLHELGIPHFHHEIVYELLVKCLEENSVFSTSNANAACSISSKESTVIETYLKLLNQLTTSGEVTVTQFENGLKRVFEEIVDLAVDIPGAFVSLDALCERFEKELLILDGVLRKKMKADSEKSLADANLSSLMQEVAVTADKP